MNIFMHLFIAMQPALNPTPWGRDYTPYAYGPRHASSGDGKTSKKVWHSDPVSLLICC